MKQATTNPARIVVMEDSPTDVRLLRYALDLHNEPYELKVLTDGEQALRFVEEHRTEGQDREPCVIVLDLHLPRYDGLAVLRAIKGAPALAHIHVVILTAQASPAEELEMRRLGVRLYRAKPMDFAGLTAVAAEILEVCKEGLLAA